RHINGDQGGRQKGDLAAHQPEAAVDVAGEDTEKIIDNAGIVHGLSPCPKNLRRLASQAASQPASGMVRVRQRRRSASTGVSTVFRSGASSGCAGRLPMSATPAVTARAMPPKAPAIAIFAVRPMSVLPPKPPKAFAPFCFDRGITRGIERLRSSLGGEGCGEIGELLGLQGEQLIARLGRGKGTTGRLARPDKRIDAAARAVDIADDACLDAQGVLQGSDAILPARIGIRDHPRMVTGQRGSGVAILEGLLDALDIIGN